jgi:hypothetical protein
MQKIVKRKPGRPPGQPFKPRKPRKEPAILEITEPNVERIEHMAPVEPELVEVKHKTEWSEMRPIDEAPEEEPEIIEEIEEEDFYKPRKPSERDEIRKKLAKAGMLAGSQLKLTIERYQHSDVVDGQGGTFGEREHCTKYVCTEEHVLSEDYMDVARRFGPGLYRLTLRHKNIVVTTWDKRVVGAATPVNKPNVLSDPNAPQIDIPTNPTQPIAVIDPVDQLVKSAQAYQKLRKAFEPDAPNPATQVVAQAPIDPKIAALQLIAENPDVMEKIGKGIASTVLGNKATGNGDPWADVAMEAIKSGQAASIVRTAIDALFTGINGLFPPKGNNGQASITMAPQMPQMAQVQQSGNGVPPPPARQAPPQPPPPPADNEQERPQQLAPVDALVYSLIAAMSHNAPVTDAHNIINVAAVRNPELAESIDELLSHNADELFVMLRAWRPDIEKLDHAKPWLESLVASFEPGGAGETTE